MKALFLLLTPCKKLLLPLEHLHNHLSLAILTRRATENGAVLASCCLARVSAGFMRELADVAGKPLQALFITLFDACSETLSTFGTR